MTDRPGTPNAANGLDGFEVIEPGVQTTVQDSGRPGYFSKGIPCSGAQDNCAFRLANALVGNPGGVPHLRRGDLGSAALEILLRGPKLRARRDLVVAVTGAEVPVRLDGVEVPMWQALHVPAGAVLEIGTARLGLRAYLAVGGGFAVPLFLGSRSTYLPGRLGGFGGRALSGGDLLAVDPGGIDRAELTDRRLGGDLLERLLGGPGEAPIRVMPGPQEQLFGEAALRTFYESEWTLSPTSNRIGFRFEGPELEFDQVDGGSDDPSQIVDDVTPLGGIQVPGGLEPIVMGVDFPSSGGYAKIGTVALADLRRVAQLRPGETTSFLPVSVAEATEALQALERDIAAATAAAGGTADQIATTGGG